MYGKADKQQGSNVRSINNDLSTNSNQLNLASTNNNSQAIAQKNLQKAANNSPQVKQLRAYQQMADNRPGSIAQKMGAEIEDPLQGKFETYNAISSAVQPIIQRKIKIENHNSPENVLEYCKSRMLYFVSPSELMDEVMDEKPPKVKKQLEAELVYGFSFSKLNTFLDEWHTDGGTFTYTNDTNGFKKLAKDAIKNYLNKHYNWRSIGTAEYMTGDATGLAMVPLVDPALTVKVLTGDQRKAPFHPSKAEFFMADPPKTTEENQRIQGPSFLNNRKKLPEYFDAAQQSGGIAFSSTDDNESYQGTSDRYSTVYNQHTRGAVKPWNKETYEATRVIGDSMHDPEKVKLLREQMQLGSSEKDTALKSKIAEYKKLKLDPVLEGKNCLILWGRNSGQKGGAHKELDSHKLMIMQLAAKLKASFADRKLVFVGDQVISKEELAVGNEIVYLGEFWKPENSGEAYAPSLRDRNAQRYLFQLLHDENRAVSIGMRSGSLEGMALLGLNVIFIDDKDNNAAERMEFWAGGAANDRASTLSNHPDDFAKQAELEKAKEGPMPNYKRIATVQKLGDEIDKRFTILQKGQIFYKNLLTEKDHAKTPACTATGTATGLNLTKSLIDNKDYADLLTNKMTDKPAVITGFIKGYEGLMNTLLSTNYKGSAATIKPSTFKFSSAKITGIILKVTTMDVNDTQKLALTNLQALLVKVDLAGINLSGDTESETGAKLLSKLITKNFTIEDLQTFNAQFNQQKPGFDGKKIKEAASNIKFKTTDITALVNASTLLIDHNQLQTNEKEQVAFLVKYLTP